MLQNYYWLFLMIVQVYFLFFFIKIFSNLILLRTFNRFIRFFFFSTSQFIHQRNLLFVFFFKFKKKRKNDSFIYTSHALFSISTVFFRRSQVHWHNQPKVLKFYFNSFYQYQSFILIHFINFYFLNSILLASFIEIMNKFQEIN